MYFNPIKAEYDGKVEIMATYKNLVAFTGMVSDQGIQVDELGRKIVPRGSLLDANGVIKNDSTVIGVLLEDVDVTNGPDVGSIVEEGYILKDRLPVSPSTQAISALSKVTFK